MAPPLPPPAPGVAVVQVRTPPSLQTPARRAHVAIYTGMGALELASVLQSVLELPAETMCTGFLVVDAHSSSHHHQHRHRQAKKNTLKKKTKRHSAFDTNDTYQRIVPLSLACLAPDLLTTPSGYVTALVAHDRPPAAVSSPRAHKAPLASASSTDDTSTAASTRKPIKAVNTPSPAPLATASAVPADANERIRRFVAAMSDDHALTKFEAAVLLELCEQQAPEVLRAMRSSSDSVAHKQQFLLRFVRGPTDLNGANSAASALAARPLETSSSAPAAALASPSHASNAQVAVVAAKVVAIARSVFSPQVQTEILDAAVAYRAKHDSSAPSDASLSQKMELLGLIERLLRKHALPEEQVAYLVRLVLNENRLLLSALQSHRLDQSASDLEKAVQQIAALGPGPATSSTTKSPKKRTSSLTKRASSPRKSARAPQPVLQGVVARPIDILHALHQKQLLTTLEYDLLAALVKQQDTQVLAAIDAFERSRDVATLRDALVFIVEDITTELGDDERAAIASRRSDRNGAASGGTAHWQAHIVALVHHWRDRDLLDAEYVPVLEALVATRHNLLQSAYEVFVSDGDASELLDTLQRIAKLQRQADDGAALEQFSRVVDAHCDVLRESEKALVKQLFVRRNALVQAAWDVYGVEQNVHDLGDTLLRIARFTSRADAKLRLVEVVGEMLRRRLVRSHEADGLIRLFEEKNDALLAAAEAFESDGDVNELVETLLLVVKHANFGDPPVCSPRHAHRSRFRTVSTAPSLEFGESGTDERAALQLIERLRATGRLADWQREVLMTLVGQHDDRVLAAMDVYNDDADVRELVDTLSCLCDLLVWDEHAPSIVREWVTPLEQRGAVPRGVLQELIANRDDRVLAAFVVYLGDRNDDEFVDSLERIARIATRQSAESMTERVDCAIDLARADAQLAALVTDGLLSSSDCATVKTLVRASHAQVLAAFDVLDATDDRSDFVDTLARILARHANSGAEDGRSEALASSTASPIARMEKQLLHFASELRLAPAALAALKRSIARQDEILTAAVEVYEVEQDEEDLKDTLKRVALHVVEAERQ